MVKQAALTLPPELFKYDGKLLSHHLTKLVEKIWEQKKILEEWKTGILVPIHKKGDITNAATTEAYYFLILVSNFAKYSVVCTV